MRAAQINQYGDPSVITINQVATPAVGEGQVLVEVHASSINPFDGKLRSGQYRDTIPLRLPVTLGGDFAGVVVEVGSGVSGLAAGDKVYGQAAAVAGNSGAFADYAVTKAGQVAKAPADLDFLEAASLPLVGVSAIQALYDHIGLQAGQKLLVTGGAGGIGTAAIQIARQLGARVTATASGESLELVRQLGADEVVDYKSQDLSALPADFDAVFDTVGGETFSQILRLVKPDGTAVSMTGPVDEALAAERGVTAISQSTKVTTAALDRLRELVEAGAIKPQVGRVYDLDDIAEAFRAKEAGRIAGKVVIRVRQAAETA